MPGEVSTVGGGVSKMADVGLGGMATQLRSRPFLMGVSTQCFEIDGADKAKAAAEQWARSGNILNIFSPIRWNALCNKPLFDGHEDALLSADAARAKGLQLSLVVDFTHDGKMKDDVLSGVGLVNGFPDGSPLPAGGLDNAEIRAAYRDELLEVVRRVRPEFVFVGLEINIFHYRLPRMWPSFVRLYSDCYDSVKAEWPDTQVSVYTAGLPDRRETAALRMLLPRLDNLAYSIYCDEPWLLPDGYLSRIRQIASELPLFIPEFGIRTNANAADEADQARALRFYLEAFAAIDTQALIWCHLYDQDFSTGPAWFRDAFETIGLVRRDGKPKAAYRLWREVLELPPLFQDLWRVLLGDPRTRL